MSSRTRAQVYEDLKDLRRRGELLHVKSAKDALERLGTKTGIFHIPGVGKLVIKKPAAKARKGANPLSGEPMVFKAKPARKTVRTRPAKAPSQEPKLFRVLEIQALADRVFGNEKRANVWLNRPNPSMSGQIPLDLMKDELGAAVVREALEQIDHGIFA